MKEVSGKKQGSATARSAGLQPRQILCPAGQSARFLIAASAALLVFCSSTACVLQPDAETTLKTAGLKHVSADDDPSLGGLARDAEAVVVARVIGKRHGRMARGSSQQPFPSTLVDLEVEWAIRGDVGDVITVEQTGGGLTDLARLVDGDHGSYEIGSRVMLFLKAQPETGHYYVPTAAGHFDVVEDELRATVPGSRVGQALDLLPVEEAASIIETDNVNGGVTTCVATLNGCTRISFQPCCYDCPPIERRLCLD